MLQRWRAVSQLCLRRWRWQVSHRWERTPIGVRFALTLTVILIGLFTPWLLINLSYFNDALAHQAQLNHKRLLKTTELAIERELMRILSQAEDYSVWNDAREAVLKHDLKWLRTNTTDWLTQHFYYDTVAVILPNGKILLSNGVESQWLQRLSLVQDALRGKGNAGLIRRNGTVYMMSAAPIGDEEWKHPPVGALVLAKSLNKAQLSQLSEQIGGKAVLTLNTKIETLSPDANGNHSEGVILRDPSGNPVALLEIESPQAATLLTHDLLHKAKRTLVGASFIVAILASLLLVGFLRAYIARFLTAIHRLASGDWEARIPYAARDEFGFLAQTFNTMAIQLQQAFEEQERQREEIQTQNEELQALYQQLHAAHQALAQLNAELMEANRTLEQAALTDGLTGLKNHRAFQESLHNLVQMAERHQQSLSLIMLDIDHFKEFNDRFGHPAGDELLKQVAEVLRESARAYDVAARYGGEEFALLLPNTSLKQAVQVAERIRTQISQIQNPHAPVSASLGVASYRHGTAPATLLYEADAALYRAKRNGRNQVCIYQPEAA